MDMTGYYVRAGEKPLDTMPEDGGLAGIFRRVVCIGDSMASGEFESKTPDGKYGFHDMFEYSWGQYFARFVGTEVLNFSRGGMTAIEYCQNFAESKGLWDADKLSPCYVIALGGNDLIGMKMPVGSASDINAEDYEKNNTETFAGWYARIIQRLKKMQPKARFFLMTMLHTDDPVLDAVVDAHAALLYEFADVFDFTYVIDFAKYGPYIDDEYRRNFFLGTHLNSAGYLLTSRMLASYMDYIIRNNPEDFAQVGFIGTPYHHCEAKW
ncbi:MAG: SGNH/GDSL hydrolase family protein [Clostridia bacterium]|nr:SGNH/GDSL hydrolase family protein [Clostridia bacterium]